MSLDDDRLTAFYNQELMALSALAEMPRRLERPDAKARAFSPICGSEVEIDLQIKDGKITGFGFEVEACALTRAVLGVMQQAIIGKTGAEVAAAGESLAQMLERGAKIPYGDWERLKVLAPVKDYKARHNAILLPFEAVEKAFKSSEK